MTFEDRLWALLDYMHLGAFFDAHNIPPLVFPVLIVAIILLILFLSIGSGGQGPGLLATNQTGCGDGVCQIFSGETDINCPQDCTSSSPACGNSICETMGGENKDNCPQDCDTSNKVMVLIVGGTDCNIFQISLMGANDKILSGPKSTKNRRITFDEMPNIPFYAQVSSPDSTDNPITSDLVTDSENVRIPLPDGYCSKEVPEEFGNLRLRIQDSVSAKRVVADVTLYDSSNKQIDYRSGVENCAFSSLKTTEQYYARVTANGYEEYKSRSLFVKKGQTTTEDLLLVPLPYDQLPKATLSVCANGLTDDATLNIYDDDDELVNTTSYSGDCTDFEIIANKDYTIDLRDLSSDCAVPSSKGPITLTEGAKEKVTFDVYCGSVGDVNAVVYSLDGDVVTWDYKIRLYLSNGSLLGAMPTEEDEIYTDKIPVQSGKKVYAVVSNPPEDILPPISETLEVLPGKLITLEIPFESLPHEVECFQPVKFKVDGDSKTELLDLYLSGSRGGIEHEIDYKLPPGSIFSLADVQIAGLDEAGPVVSVKGDTMDLKIDIETGDVVATAYCPLVCGGLGDLDSSDTINDTDIQILSDLIDALDLGGKPNYDPWPPDCADIDGDSKITENDLVCLLDYNPDCPMDCAQSIGDRASDLEICNDGLDNDCDGQTDSDTYDEARELPYTYAGADVDLCDCTPVTPCDMVKDLSGGLTLDNLGKCANVSFKDEGYTWYAKGDWECTTDRVEQNLSCGGTSFCCDGSEWLPGACGATPAGECPEGMADCDGDGQCECNLGTKLCSFDDVKSPTSFTSVHQITSIHPVTGRDIGNLCPYPKGFKNQVEAALKAQEDSGTGDLDTITFNHPPRPVWYSNCGGGYSPPESYRAFIPPGTIDLYGQMQNSVNSGAVYAMRFKSPPRENHDDIIQTGDPFIPECSLHNINRFFLEEDSAWPGYCVAENDDIITSAGQMIVPLTGGLMIPEPVKEGGWFYIQILYGSDAMITHSFVWELTVDKDIFMQWYENAEFDEYGDPVELVADSISNRECLRPTQGLRAQRGSFARLGADSCGTDVEVCSSISFEVPFSKLSASDCKDLMNHDYHYWDDYCTQEYNGDTISWASTKLYSCCDNYNKVLICRAPTEGAACAYDGDEETAWCYRGSCKNELGLNQQPTTTARSCSDVGLGGGLPISWNDCMLYLTYPFSQIDLTDINGPGKGEITYCRDFNFLDLTSWDGYCKDITGNSNAEACCSDSEKNVRCYAPLPSGTICGPSQMLCDGQGGCSKDRMSSRIQGIMTAGDDVSIDCVNVNPNPFYVLSDLGLSSCSDVGQTWSYWEQNCVGAMPYAGCSDSAGAAACFNIKNKGVSCGSGYECYGGKCRLDLFPKV